MAVMSDIIRNNGATRDSCGIERLKAVGSVPTDASMSGYFLGALKLSEQNGGRDLAGANDDPRSIHE